MSMKDKAREKLMSSMRKTKDGIKDDTVENKPVINADDTAKANTKPAEIPVKETPETTAQKAPQKAPQKETQKAPQKRDDQIKKDTPKVGYLKSTRVWPD